MTIDVASGQDKQTNSLSNEYLYGQPFYPVAPLSWLAPLWSFICGVVASASWTWTSSSLLRVLSGLLLVGPLLGTVWGASTQIKYCERTIKGNSQPQNPNHGSLVVGHWLIYTLPGSTSHRLATWLTAVSAWWQQAKPRLGKPLVQLVVSTIFALAVAAQLSQQSLAITAIGLTIAYASGFSRGRRLPSLMFSVPIPLFLTWLLGHTTYNALRPASILVAACFALAFYGCAMLKGRVNQGLMPLVWQVVPQGMVVASLVAVKQPLTAAIVALLVTPQLLLSPLRETPSGGEQYFRAVQWQITANMFLTALALGYGP